MDGLMFQAVTGGVIALLLSIISYFLKLLIQDFRQMRIEHFQLKEAFSKIETEQLMIRAMLSRSWSPQKSKTKPSID